MDPGLMLSGRLTTQVAFDAEVLVPDGYGGQDRSWNEAFRARAQIRYQSGREAVEAGGLTGTASFKVRIRRQDAVDALTTDYRMRDLNEDLVFNIREIDRVTDRKFVWLVVENGVAV
ncbi:head-tail adaptor protein [Aestuariibius insulae]|uniref:head-tail adaptor protein n=1 Tax=Aestuariibius insulae TaxID=2058287 RepID=UPI00398E4098